MSPTYTDRVAPLVERRKPAAQEKPYTEKSARRSIVFTTTALAVALAAPHAYAQEGQSPVTADDEYTLNRVVVEARKRSEAVSDIPESIDVVTAETIEKAGITTLDDVGRQTPNVVLNTRRDNEPNVVIRGIGGFGNTQGVGFYRDDVQNFTDQSASIEDVERIEILKGPQGTLYGGSNIGGAIKYVMKKPGDTFGLEGKAEYGSFETFNLFAATDLPVSDSFAARLSAYSRQTDGYSDNTFLDKDADEAEEWGLRAAFRWEPAEDLTVDLSYRHNELENGGFIYVIAADGADYSQDVDVNEDIFTERTVDGGILSADYDAGAATITSVTSYTVRSTDALLDLDYTSADGVTAYAGDRNETKVFTQELRAASAGDGPFEWLVGAYYADIDNRGLLNNIDLRLGADAGGPVLIEDFNNADAVERQLALFGTVGYRFDRLKLEGGLRVAETKFTANFLSAPVPEAEVKDTKVLPKFTVSYDPTPEAMLYGNVALGSEPGRANLGNDLGGETYEPEDATSYELGIKGDTVGGRLTYDFAAFYIDYTDRQFESRAVLSSGIITEFITNVGDSKSYGLEGGISYQATPDLTLAASAGYLEAEWDDSGALYNFEPIDGLEVPNSPGFTATASVDYTKPLSNGLEFGLRADLSHMGEFYWTVLNDAEQPSYDIFNLRLSLGKPAAGWEVAIRGENIFDAEYFTEYTPDVFGPGLGLGAPGRPASMMVSLSVDY